MSASVILLNYDRQGSLSLTLAALAQQSRRDFEIIIVTNQPAAIDAAVPWDMQVRVCPFNEANVSAARNVGLMASRGALIAFCDDDAVPEPQWLAELLSPFSDPTVGAVGGSVLRANGITLQWPAAETDVNGVDHAIPPLTQNRVFPPSTDRVAKTPGTSCAYRRAALRQVRGFDPTFRYFLDETDTTRRISAAGWSVALAPRALVHHQSLEGPHRRANRVPKTLFEVGASKAAFIARHGGEAEALAAFRDEQRRRLVRQMLLGRVDGRGIRTLLETLSNGFEEGARRKERPGLDLPEAGHVKAALPAGPPPETVEIEANLLTLSRQFAAAANIAGPRTIVRLYDVRPLWRQTTVTYFLPGIWRHRGGVWGRTFRDEMAFIPKTRRGWIATERKRWKKNLE